MKSTFKTAPLTALVKSPLNVRKVRDEDPIIAQVAASISAKGLIQPIAVHALKKPKGALGVLAGQRRWRAIAKLEAEGAAFDFANIPVVLFDGADAELKEVSQAENVIREQMRPSEIYAGYREIKELEPSLTEADFSQRFGIEPARMARIMRLAFLHPEVFAAYDRGELKDEQAFAYAATTDQELQLQTFQAMAKRHEYQRHPREIREAMKVGSQEHRQLLIFVGRETYEAAGGVFEEDLFAQEANSGRVMNEDILRRLANEKLDKVKAETIAAYGDEVTIVDEPPKDKWGQSYDFRVHPRPGKPTDEQRAAIEANEARQQQIERALDLLLDDDGEVLAGKEDEERTLTDELDRLEADLADIRASIPVELPSGPKLATVTVGRDGKAEVQWFREKKERAGGKTASGEKRELGDKALATLRQMRHGMLGRMLFDTIPNAAENRALAHDALIFSLAKMNLAGDWKAIDALRKPLGMTSSFQGENYSDYGSEPRFEPDLSDIPGLYVEDAVTGFSDFTFRATPAQKDRLAAWVYWRKVQGVLFEQGRRSIPEYIGVSLSDPRTARRAWTPTATFFDMFKKDRILSWFGAIDIEFKAQREKDKAGDLKRNAVAFFAGADDAMTRFGVPETSIRHRIRTWLPEWLQWSALVPLEEPAQEAPLAPTEALEEAAE